VSKWNGACSNVEGSEHEFHKRVLDRQQRGVGMESSVYLKARQEWDERYTDLVLGKRN
jgi:hypothetical protein